MEQLQNVCEKQKTDLEKMRTLNESVNNNVERNDNVAVKIVEPDADVSGYKENLQHSANETQKVCFSLFHLSMQCKFEFLLLIFASFLGCKIQDRKRNSCA